MLLSLPIIEPPLRVMALHALRYCERLFYLEEVEEIRVADAAVYAGRELHESLADEGGESWEQLDVADPQLGIFGRVDCLKRRDGDLIPYEHKRGRCKREEDGTPGAWETDRVQAAAYAMMLESHLNTTIPEARIRYHADNVTVRLPIDVGARAAVRAAVKRARELRQAIERPPITENEKLCRRCSLAPVCLPEEVRQEADPAHEPRRMFPMEDRRTSLHVMSDGASVGRSGDRLIVRPREGPESKHASGEIGSVLLHGFTQISTQALRLCVDQDISVHWLGAGGGHIASLTSSVGQVQRRIRQYRALCDDSVRLRLARQLVRARLESQHRFLLRATRGAESAHDRNAILRNLHGISDSIAEAGKAQNVDTLRGHEGQGAAEYFEALPQLLSSDIPVELHPVNRTRRPTTDRFSAILNFGYALLQTAVMRALLASGLEPALGFYHTPRSAAHPLVLDVMELFRVPLWDMVVIGSLNRMQWDPTADFSVSKLKTWLTDAGRRKAIELFETRLQECWKHPVVEYSLSYARTIELEARLLEKEWTGEPGLFARIRLR